MLKSIRAWSADNGQSRTRVRAESGQPDQKHSLKRGLAAPPADDVQETADNSKSSRNRTGVSQSSLSSDLCGAREVSQGRAKPDVPISFRPLVDAKKELRRAGWPRARIRLCSRRALREASKRRWPKLDDLFPACGRRFSGLMRFWFRHNPLQCAALRRHPYM